MIQVVINICIFIFLFVSEIQNGSDTIKLFVSTSVIFLIMETIIVKSERKLEILYLSFLQILCVMIICTQTRLMNFLVAGLTSATIVLFCIDYTRKK
jgi:hypothetical protein